LKPASSTFYGHAPPFRLRSGPTRRANWGARNLVGIHPSDGLPTFPAQRGVWARGRQPLVTKFRPMAKGQGWQVFTLFFSHPRPSSLRKRLPLFRGPEIVFCTQEGPARTSEESIGRGPAWGRTKHFKKPPLRKNGKSVHPLLAGRGILVGRSRLRSGRLLARALKGQTFTGQSCR